jgi:hypothetical protein
MAKRCKKKIRLQDGKANGTRWTCLFKNEHIDILPDAWMQKVGTMHIEEEHSIEVDSLFVIEDDMGEGYENGEGRSFWRTPDNLPPGQ